MILLLLFPLLINANQKVLFYVPTLSYSHVAFNGRLADLLTLQGYDVTILLVSIDEGVKSNGGAVKLAQVKRVEVGLEKGEFPRTIWTNPGPFEDASPLNPKIFAKLVNVADIFVKACKNLLSNQQLISHLLSSNFTIGFSEQYDQCGFALFHLLKIRSTTFWLSATGLYRMQPEAMGLKQPLSYVPELFSRFSDQMGFIQRIENVLVGKVTELVHKIRQVKREEELLLLNTPIDLLESAATSSALISNTHPLLDFPMPLFNSVIHIAGMTPSPNRLSPYWSNLLQRNQHHPFWLVTFGSIAKLSDMPPHMLISLLKAFAAFPQWMFIVKYEGSIMVNGSTPANNNNVFHAQWIPQLELLKHPNCIGIITHGGWSSILEAIAYKRPMVLVPLFADHFKTAKGTRSVNR